MNWRAGLAAVARVFGPREVAFYGGLVLFAVGHERWAIVGAVLAAHAWFTPILANLLTRRTG